MNPDDGTWVKLSDSESYAGGQILSFSSTTYVNEAVLPSCLTAPVQSQFDSVPSLTSEEVAEVYGVPPECLSKSSVRPDLCWHCERDRHDGPLTQYVAHMWEGHQWEDGYDPEADNTPIVCLGSDAIGPARDICSSGKWIASGDEQAAMVDQMQSAIAEDLKTIQATTWVPIAYCKHGVPADLKCSYCLDVAKLDLPDITPDPPDKVLQVGGNWHWVSKTVDADGEEIYTFTTGAGKYTYIKTEDET